MEPKQYLTELESALEQYRFREVRALTDQIDRLPSTCRKSKRRCV